MRPLSRLMAVLALLMAALGLPPLVWAQSARTLPLSEAEAEALPLHELAGLMFGAAADGIVLGQAGTSYGGDAVLGATFLMKPLPASDQGMIRYEGLCSVRRVRVTLDARDQGRTVEDIETDLAYAVIGAPAVVPDNMDAMPGDDDGEEQRRAACATWRSAARLVEAPDAGTLMLAAQALAVIPGMIDSGADGVACNDLGQACGAEIRRGLVEGRLSEVRACDPFDVDEIFDGDQTLTCVAADLFLAGDERATSTGLNVMAAGTHAYGPAPFRPTRVFIRETTTYAD